MLKFSAQAPTKEPRVQTKSNYFLSQPHQPFFLFGIVWAIVSMVVFMLGFKSTISMVISPTYFHVYALLFIVFSQFFLGFLFTTFPRFNASHPISKRFYLSVFALYEISSLGIIVGVVTNVIFLLSFVIVLFMAHAATFYQLYRVYKEGKSPIKKDPFWILVAYGFGLAAHAVFVLGLIADSVAFPFYWYDIAYASGFYMYAIFLTGVIACRMIPFFSHIQIHKMPKLLPFLFTMMVLKSIAIVMILGWVEIVVDSILGFVLLYEFRRWQLPITSSPAILWILHLALFWLPMGLILGALARASELVLNVSLMSLDTHLVALGFLTTILIGFGTRIALGHSSQPPHANAFTLKLFMATQVVVAIRILYSFFNAYELDMLWMFDLSITSWIVLFGAWGAYYAPVLIFGKKIT